MKAVAMVSAAVLIVIAIGVSLVGGGRAAPHSYEMSGLKFQVAFPGYLAPLSGQAMSDLTAAEGGDADDNHLEIVVQLFSPHEAIVFDFPRTPCRSWPKEGYALPYLLSPGEICMVAVQPKVASGQLVVAVYSTEGLREAQTVARSFRLIGGTTQQ